MSHQNFIIFFYFNYFNFVISVMMYQGDMIVSLKNEYKNNYYNYVFTDRYTLSIHYVLIDMYYISDNDISIYLFLLT